MKRPTIAVLQLLTAIGIVLFWLQFFIFGFDTESYPDCYPNFEHSFPLPDTFLVIMLILAYINRKKIHWKQYTLIASGAMIFLGLCDFSFNLLNGMYAITAGDTIMNAGINIWCVLFGGIQIVHIFKSYENSGT
ncbi:MAG: hypothetical protein K1X55_13340 [Chitinophagales bacterium]|nr:hypothetical protein [Chitinophagales bacterium]